MLAVLPSPQRHTLPWRCAAGPAQCGRLCPGLLCWPQAVLITQRLPSCLLRRWATRWPTGPLGIMPCCWDLIMSHLEHARIGGGASADRHAGSSQGVCLHGIMGTVSRASAAGASPGLSRTVTAALPPNAAEACGVRVVAMLVSRRARCSIQREAHVLLHSSMWRRPAAVF